MRYRLMNLNGFCYLLLMMTAILSLLMPHPFLVWLLAINMLTLMLYGADKAAAKRDRRRVAERTLLLFGLLGGWPGALCGQHFFRHKTKKQPFRRWFFLSVAVNICGLCAVFWQYGP